MRSLALAVAVLAIPSCSSSTDTGVGVPADSLGIQGTYRLAHCDPGGGSPPCVQFASGHFGQYVDSGWVTFKRDHSATWMVARRDWSCTLDSSGNETCTNTLSNAVTSGTYVITNGNVVFGGYTYAASIPTFVPTSWTGPDSLASLSVNQLSSPYSAIFKPQ
jgi:hypothetical protein